MFFLMRQEKHGETGQFLPVPPLHKYNSEFWIFDHENDKNRNSIC